MADAGLGQHSHQNSKGGFTLQRKRKIALLLVIVMILSSFSMIGAQPEKIQRVENAPQTIDKDLDGPITLDPDSMNNWDEEQQYRVIVELMEKPAIYETMGTDEMYHQLPKEEKDSLEEGILTQQNQVINAIEDKNVDLQVLHNFTVSVNGFSALVKGSEIEEIKKTRGVKGVFISNEYERPEVTEPDMEFTHDMIGSQNVWTNLRFRGEGMVVAVVDTGIQWTHPDFNPHYDFYNLTIDQEWVESLDVPGTYRTPKVVYGYNYYDDVQTVENMNGNHGQHVAGTVAADGDIKGVAPLAQLLDIQVFGETEETTFDDIYLRGIEDALKIGVDAINMSLGSVSNFYQPNSAVDTAITNAREDGVTFAISAGNSSYSTYGIDLPWRENPDIGLVGSPSLNKDSISVASVDNEFTLNNYLTYELDGLENKAPYAPAGGFNIPEVFDAEEYAFVGFGGVEETYIAANMDPQNDFEGVDLEGKIALISRGYFAFTDKIMNAQNHGAKGVIVFNNAGDALVNMQYPADGTIPALFIGNSFGKVLSELAEPVTLHFPEGNVVAPNPTGGEMSAFTSWGTTPSLDMKPEVTAPGGMIYSTQLDGTYGAMSGTSMAAPHVAGSTALVQQYLLNEGMAREDVAEMSKILHMNTAVPLIDNYGAFYSPRRQGAGLIRPDKAIMSPVTVVNQADGEAKVQLRDFNEEVFTMTLEATNHSDEAATYNLSVDVLGDYIFLADPAAGFYHDEIFQLAFPLAGTTVTAAESVTIEPGMTEVINVTVDLTEATIPGTGGQKVMDHPNLFVEGFIHMEEVVDNAFEGTMEDYTINDAHEDPVMPLDLVVPFVGFYGDWAGENAPSILDGFGYFGEDSFFGVSGMVNQNGSFMGYHMEDGYAGADSRLAISPKNPETNSVANPVFGMMRNAAEVTLTIYDETDAVVKVIDEIDMLGDTFGLRKSFLDNPFYYMAEWAWDGTDAEKAVVADGQYYYEISALPHYDNAVWQTKSIPVMVDTVAPVVENFEYNISTDELSWMGTDEGIGIDYMELYIDDELYTTVPGNGDGYFVEAFDYDPSAILNIWVVDYAGNSAVYSPEGLKELEGIEIVTEPDQTEYYVDEELVLDGLVVHANYNDGSSVVIPHENLEVTGFDSSAAAIDQVITVNYNEFSASFMVDIIVYVPGMEELRIAGDNRYETAYEVAMEAYGEIGAETVILVRGDDKDEIPQVIDALSASGLAGVEHAPILLTRPNSLHDAAERAITELGAENVMIIGGINAISIDVETLLEDMGLTVERVHGVDRYETAAEVAKRVLDGSNGVTPTAEVAPKTAIIAHGRALVDSLAAGPLAHETGAPILLVNHEVPAETQKIIEDYGIENLIIVGGTAVVSAEVQTALEALVTGDVDRVEGDTTVGENRYGTSINLAKTYFQDSEGAVLVNGFKFVDAVAASILGMPILYVEEDNLRDDVRDVLELKETFRVVGGNMVISDSVLADAYQTVYPTN